MARISGTRTPSRTTAPKDTAKAKTPKKPEAKETKGTGWKPKASGGSEASGGGGATTPRSTVGGSEAGGGGRVSVPSSSGRGGGGE